MIKVRCLLDFKFTIYFYIKYQNKLQTNCKCNLNTFRDFEKKSVNRILLW